MVEWWGIGLESSSIMEGIIWIGLDSGSDSRRDKVKQHLSYTIPGLKRSGIEGKSSKYIRTGISNTEATWMGKRYWFLKKITWRDI
jgi:hypothetical protein